MKFQLMRKIRSLAIARKSWLPPQALRQRNLMLEHLEHRRVFDGGWAQGIQGALVWDVDSDAAGNNYLTGTFVSQAQFGDKTLVTSTNGAARFVAKSDSAGQFLWAVKFA